MFIDDWPTQATRSVWHIMQQEYPQTLRNVLGNDHPTLDIAAKRLRTWIEEKRIRVPKFPDPNFVLEREMIDYAFDEVDWAVLTCRIAKALKVSVNEISDTIICSKCQNTICQMCLLCPNPSCGDAHQVDCLSEYPCFQLGPILFDFIERKLVVRIGNFEMPVSHNEYKRFFNWIDIRKDG